MYVRKDVVIINIVTTILLVFTAMWGGSFNYSQDLESGIIELTIYCLFIYLWIFLSSYYVKNRIDIYSILILITIPFYLGDQLSVLLGYQEYMLASDHSILDGIIPNGDIFKAMFYLSESLLALHFGYMIGIKNKVIAVDSHFEGVIAKENSQRNKMRFIALVLYFATIIPALIIRIYDIYMSMVMGHLAYRLYGAVSGILYYFDYFADWFAPACLMLLVFCKNSFEQKVATFSIIGYCGLYLLSGNRMEIVGIAFATLCVYIYWYDLKISAGNVIKFAILGILLISVFLAVGSTRNASGGFDMFSAETFSNIFGGKFLYSIFETTGNTFTSIANTIRCVPSMIDYNYGKSVLGSLLYILPSSLREPYLSSIVTHISSVLSPYYYGWNLAGYGSSFITEAFFNFGYFGLLIICVYGAITSKIINVIENCDKNKPFVYYAAIYMILEIANAIRNDLYFIPRHVVLYVLIPYFLSLFLSKRSFR